jgi:hypothetical protein
MAETVTRRRMPKELTNEDKLEFIRELEGIRPRIVKSRDELQRMIDQNKEAEQAIQKSIETLSQ